MGGPRTWRGAFALGITASYGWAVETGKSQRKCSQGRGGRARLQQCRRPVNKELGLYKLCRNWKCDSMVEQKPEQRKNEPLSGGFEVSPGRKPRVRVGKFQEPRSGATGRRHSLASPGVKWGK